MRKHTNGLLKDFDAEELMEKVLDRACALNTVRTIGTDTYIIAIFGSGWGDVNEIDYYYSIIREDKDDNQKRITSSADMKPEELVKSLNTAVSTICGMY